MIKVGNASLSAISGKHLRCKICKGTSVTMFEIRLGNVKITACPYCKSNLSEIFEKESNLYDGY
jgi:hypothetical protein